MNCMKRAFVSLIRKPAKSFILLLLIFILCNVIAGAISVKNALVATKRALLEKMGAEVRVEIDYDWIINAGEDFDYSMLGKVDKNMVDKMSQSPYLKRAYYTATMYCQGFEVYDPQSDEEYPWEMYFNVEGCNQATLKDVENNKIVIASGRTYNAEEIANGAAVAVIAQSVAERNNLSWVIRLPFTRGCGSGTRLPARPKRLRLRRNLRLSVCLRLFRRRAVTRDRVPPAMPSASSAEATRRTEASTRRTVRWTPW